MIRMVIIVYPVQVMSLRFNSQIMCVEDYLYFQTSWRCGLITLKRVMNCLCNIVKYSEHPKIRWDDRMDLKGQTLAMLMIVIFLILIMVMMINQNQNFRQNKIRQ